MNKHPKQKGPGPDEVIGECYQIIFKKEIIPIFCNLFQRIEAEGILPSSFYEANIALILKPDNPIRRKENYRLISLMNIDAKVLNEISAHTINNV